MVVISTFVIFDIETTGLPKDERNRTKITELTFLAVNRHDIESTSYGRVPLINKLSYLFNPQRNIHPEVRTLTGLSNESLQHQPMFNNRIRSLNSFLEELSKPVCLVAHNGNSFDFKLLRSEYIDANATLPDDLLCVDTLWAFRKILKETNLCHETLNNSSEDVILTDDEDWPELNTSLEEWDEIDRLTNSFLKISPISSPESKKSKIIGKNDLKSPLIHKPVTEKKPETFKLQAVYKRLLNKDAVNAHRSEADCLMLLECIIALKDYFLPYANDKCKLINKVLPFERH